MAKYDIRNPLALRRLVAGGAQLRPFPIPVLDVCFKAANELCTELAAKNEDFKKMWEAMRAVRSDDYLWFQFAENTFDSYMMIQQRNGKLAPTQG